MGTLDLPPFVEVGLADSRFDLNLRVEVDTPNGLLVLFSAQPKVLRTTISHKPPAPGDLYEGTTLVPLVDIDGNDSGFSLGAAFHRPDPGTVERDFFQDTTALIQLQGLPNTQGPVPFILRGPAQANVFFEGNAEGDANDSNGNGLDDVATQLMSLNLAGGGISLSLNNAAGASLGQIEEKQQFIDGILDLDPFGEGGSANSFFDVFFQIDANGLLLHNQDALRIEAMIDEKPPEGARYIHVIPDDKPIELFDANGNPTGVFIVKAEHVIGVIEIDQFDATVGHILLELPGQGVVTPDPQLPPTNGEYRSASQVHAKFSGPDLDVVLQDVRHRAIANTVVIIPDGDSGNEIEQFDSLLRTTATVNGVVIPLDLKGPVQTVVLGKKGQTTGSWDTEILSMDLRGQVPGGPAVLIRENPQLASQGQTNITNREDGLFNIDSFFDVFTEVSLDGGETWTPATDPVRVDLAPEPLLIPAVGPATVNVFFEGNSEGDADDDNNDGRDEVETEIVSMALSGWSPMGPVQIGLRPDRRSGGQIIEQVQVNPGTLDLPPFTISPAAGLQADSFFDVWPEIRIGNQVFHTNGPVPLDTAIRHKPPQDGERYVNPFPTRIELIDPATGEGTGIYVIREVHQPDSTVEVDNFDETTALIQLQGGAVGPNPTAFVLRGPSQARVYFEGRNEGIAIDDDLDGRDDVATELAQLNLTNGNVTLTLNPNQPSLGQIEEFFDNTTGLLDVPPFGQGLANSFFDVFFELDVAGVGVLHNGQPLRIESVIDHKPPQSGTRYIHVLPGDQPIELLDKNNDPTGIFIVDAQHVIGHVEIDEFDFSIGEVELIDPTGKSETIPVDGPTTVHVFFEGKEGAADDDNNNGRDEVQTEIVSLSLTGDSSRGPLRISLNPNIPSTGGIEEVDQVTQGRLDLPPFGDGVADSFFDVFFQIDIGTQTFFTTAPKRMSTVITNKPPAPGDVYENLDRIPLFDAFGNDTGFSIGATRHAPNPPAAGSIHGFKFEDVDANGGYDPQIDQPLGNVGFTLTGNDEQGVQIFLQTFTNDSGEFWFDDVPPSDSVGYLITEVLPVGFITTTPRTFRTPLQAGEELVAFAGQAMLDPGEVEIVFGTELMFGNTVRGSIHGFKFQDFDANGIFDGNDVAVADVDFRLTGIDFRGNQLPTQVTTTEFTDPQTGEFSFENLIPGNYTVTEIVPAGSEPTTPSSVNFDLFSRQELVWRTGAASLPTSGDPRVEVLVGTSLMFGNASPSTIPGSIHGFSFEDRNGNGFQDTDEFGFSGILFTLTNETTGQTVETNTVENGEFWFVDLAPGNYTVRATTSTGVVTTTNDSFSRELFSGEELVWRDGAAMLPANDPRFEVNIGTELTFGHAVLGSIHGLNFDDGNADGQFNFNDIGLNGTEFSLKGFDNLGNQVDLRTTAGPNEQFPNQPRGEFAFVGLMPGNYTLSMNVESLLPPGREPTGQLSFNINLLSRQEWVALDGQARLGGADPRGEVFIGPELMFGSIFFI